MGANVDANSTLPMSSIVKPIVLSGALAPVIFFYAVWRKFSRAIRRMTAIPQGGASIIFLMFMGMSLLTRMALMITAWSQLDHGLVSLGGAFLLGFLFDAGAALLLTVGIAFALSFLPSTFFSRKWGRALAHIMLCGAMILMVFSSVAEWFFWEEFGTRFNFIAVDYLIYTTEVLGNIRESYPLGIILPGVVLSGVLFYAMVLRTGLPAIWLKAPRVSPGRRWTVAVVWAIAALLAGSILDSRRMPSFRNTFNAQIAGNGLWSFAAAFRNNELDYTQFYAVLPIEDAFKSIRRELARDGCQFLSGEDSYDTLRFIRNEGEEKHLNVIQITVESLSAAFLGIFNPDADSSASLTPNIDTIAKDSLVFTNFYATGTRTDRGMEALSLSLPPTPGRSLIKRNPNSGLFTLGSIFRSRGYDTAFIYGGFGYFDNMNTFFGGNGYRIVDRASVKKEDVSFANAWGACDQDTLRWVLREADLNHEQKKPFHFFVMTTSNHRPYTFPDGCIDMPSGSSGRAGAVKYTDYAVGEFIQKASKKPWFKDTVFVIVADHCASSAGKAELPVQNYHIPLIIYAPGGQIERGRVNTLMSQIDYAPTLLGLLNWSYASRFYGWDVLKAGGDRRALIGNYQKLGFYESGLLTVLRPLRGVSQYAYDYDTHSLSEISENTHLIREAISYYQTAAYQYRHGVYRAISSRAQRHFRREQEHRKVSEPAHSSLLPVAANTQ